MSRIERAWESYFASIERRRHDSGCGGRGNAAGLRQAGNRADCAANAASSAPAAVPMPDYHPSLGDLMTMAIQPRHTKLGLAGAAGNWPYALYELSELRNAFARVARTVPVYRSIDMTAVIGALTTEP